MAAVKENLAKDYERIRSRSRLDPGTAGDQVEEDWASILRLWLPASYHVVTKGRILFEDQTSSPQVDVIVLKPTYPAGLRNQKYYFAGGVAAAFECKLTLRLRDLRKTFNNAMILKRSIKRKFGTPFDELRTPITYGLLAHSHEIKGDDNRVYALYEAIQREMTRHAEHPRELPDLFCVADTATVPLGITVVHRSDFESDELDALENFDDEFLVDTLYVIHQENLLVDQTGAILAGLINDLTLRIAAEDANVREWADHLSSLGFYGGIGRPLYWRSDVLSPEVRKKLSKKLVEGNRWSPWNKFVT